MSVVAFDGDGDDAAAAGGDFLNVAEGLFVLEDAGGVVGVFGGDADYGEGFVDEGVGAVLHLAGGVAFGVDVGDLLELEGAFEGDGVVDAAAEEEEVVGGVEDFGELYALGVEGEAGALRRLAARVAGSESSGCGESGAGRLRLRTCRWRRRRLRASMVSSLAGILESSCDEVEGFGVGDGAADLREVEGEEEEGGELGGEGLGGGDADLGAGVGGDGALGFAGDGGSDDVADGEGLGAFGDELALGGEGVGGFAGLGDEEADGVGVGDGVAVAVLGGVVDVDGEAGEALDHELAGEAGVPGGSAGGDGDLGGGAEVGVGDGRGRRGRRGRCRGRRGRGWCRGWRGAAR